MAHSSSYAPIDDGTTVLKFGADIDKTWNFDCPGLAADQQSVLVFVTNPDPSGKDSDVAVSMNINGSDVLGLTFTSTEGRTWQEIVQGGLLKEKGNKLTAKLTDSDNSGEISLADLVLHYKLA